MRVRMTIMAEAAEPYRLFVEWEYVARLYRIYRKGDLPAVDVQHPQLRTPQPSGPDFIAKRVRPSKPRAR